MKRPFGMTGVWALAPLPWLAYALGVWAAREARWDHALVAAAAVGLVAGGERGRRWFSEGLPFLLLFVAYDSLRYLRTWGLVRAHVLTCELRELERGLFGLQTASGRLTPNEFFAQHHHWAVDVACAVPYGGYLLFMGGSWVLLRRSDELAARRFAWTAFTTHLLGFLTYQLLPAAPPWYVATHGCTVLGTVSNSTAALERVDAWLGIPYFRDLYSRGRAVFGALPSLHVAYPWLGLLCTWGRVRRRVVLLQVGYAVLMAFASIYLGHHYVLDGLLGVTYALVGYASSRLLVRQGVSAPCPAPPHPSGQRASEPPAARFGSQSVSGTARS